LSQIQVANERILGLKKENDVLNTTVKDMEICANSWEQLVKSLEDQREGLIKKNSHICSRKNLGLNTVFSSQELEQATQNFSESLKIGGGGFGTVYKGSLHQITVAIKLLDNPSVQGITQFQREVNFYV
jgi:hypothetical protein